MLLWCQEHGFCQDGISTPASCTPFLSLRRHSLLLHQGSRSSLCIDGFCDKHNTLCSEYYHSSLHNIFHSFWTIFLQTFIECLQLNSQRDVHLILMQLVKYSLQVM